MNKPQLLVVIANSLGADPILETDTPDDVFRKEAKLKKLLGVSEAVLHDLVPHLVQELRRINGQYISKHTVPNNTNPIHVPLSHLIEGLESDE